MRVIIAGGSTFDSLDYMNKCLSYLRESIEVVISGRGWGADKKAETFAAQHGMDLELFPANWGRYGEDAGYVRWSKVFSTQNIDKVILFWNGKSPGTKVLKLLADEHGIPCEIYYYEEDDYGSESA